MVNLDKKRKCFGCGIELDYDGFMACNLNQNITFLLNIWCSSKIQLYCCNCFKKKTGKNLSDFVCYSNFASFGNDEDFCDDEEYFITFGEEY